MNNKKQRIMYSIGLSSIALALALMIWPTNNNSALAQQNSTATSGAMAPNRPNPMMSMSSGLQNQNWTGSISLASPILDMFKSKIHTTLNSAITSAIGAVGGGATGAAAGSNASTAAVAAFIHPENGFLVYNVFVLDPSNNIHRVIVDPGNGRVLSNQQMSMMEMMFMMHHPSMGMGGMMMGPPHGMDMLQHGMMMGRGGGTSMGMGMMDTSPQGMGMMNRGMMMDHGMGMMGPQAGGGTWP